MTRKLSSIVVALTLMALTVRGDDPPANLLKPTNKPENWRLEQHEQATGKMTAEDDAILFEVTEVDGTDWHVQAFQTPLDLKDGKTYVLTFKAKAAADRTMQVNAGIDQEDWHSIGLQENVDLTKDWKDYKYEFKADQVVAMKSRVGFQMGGDKGKIWVKEMVLGEK